MEKIDYEAVEKYLFVKKKRTDEIKMELSVHSLSIMKYWQLNLNVGEKVFLMKIIQFVHIWLPIQKRLKKSSI